MDKGRVDHAGTSCRQTGIWHGAGPPRVCRTAGHSAIEQNTVSYKK